MTIEEVKTEYFRIEKLLGREAITQTEYNGNAQVGFSTHFIKKNLGLAFNAMKGKIGATKASSANNKINYGKPSKKIYCGRGKGEMISSTKCTPGCNDACIPCENKQMQNIGAGSDTLTPEEDKEAMIAGTWGSSSAIAVNEGHCEI